MELRFDYIKKCDICKGCLYHFSYPPTAGVKEETNTCDYRYSENYHKYGMCSVLEKNCIEKVTIKEVIIREKP